jgi:hypothetical protein
VHRGDLPAVHSEDAELVGVEPQVAGLAAAAQGLEEHGGEVGGRRLAPQAVEETHRRILTASVGPGRGHRS